MNGIQRLRARWMILACCGIGWFICLFNPTTSARGDDAAANWTTTELGVTIKHDQILDAIDRCAEFWPQVCRHIEKHGDSMAEPGARAAVVAVIRRTQFELHKQFFASDELARDAIDYTSWGLRRAALYHRVDELLNDRDVLIRVRAAWQNALTDVRSLDDLPTEIARRTTETAAELRLDLARTQQLVQTSGEIAHCMMAMESTSTAKLLRQAERLTNNPQARNLLHDVIDAADWAHLTDSGEGRFGAAQFRAAWNDLTAMRRQTTVAALE
ncbi:MAG: hypothetical protein K2Y37_25775 [Pirellulales bacterium]|nr:hypothetical protein [Pirellulales bacterium]